MRLTNSFFSCPPTSELLIVVLCYVVGLICISVHTYDSSSSATSSLYPNSFYGTTNNEEALASEIYRSWWGAVNCVAAGSVTLFTFLFIPNSSIGQMCSSCARRCDPRHPNQPVYKAD